MLRPAEVDPLMPVVSVHFEVGSFPSVTADYWQCDRVQCVRCASADNHRIHLTLVPLGIAQDEPPVHSMSIYSDRKLSCWPASDRWLTAVESAIHS